MADSNRRILVAANLLHDDVGGILDDLVNALADRGLDPVPWRFGSTEEPLPQSENGEEGAELVLVLGGDGFMMHIIRSLGYRATPLYGVNYGRVGFLMNPRLEPAELADLLANRRYSASSYPVLEADIQLSDGRKLTERAFNDVVIERASGQTVQLGATIDDVFLNRYSGDGLIVATPGGSTAYSLAAGGPVVHHNVESMLVTPLCPHRPVQFHSLQFPLLLGLDSRIHIENTDPSKRPARCACDGRAFEDVISLAIQHRGLRVQLLRGPDYDFVDTLVRKVIGVRPEGFEGHGDR